MKKSNIFLHFFYTFIFAILMTYSTNLASEEINNLESIYIYNNISSQFTNEDDSSEEYDLSVIENTMPSSVDDIFRYSPAATTSGGPRSSGEQIQIRGLGAKKLFVYIDGVKQGFSTDHSTMPAIDPDNIKSVQIYKSTSNIKKSGSLGGGVLFTTKDASDYLRPGEKAGSSFKWGHKISNDENSISVKTYTRRNKSDFLLSIGSRQAKDTVLSDRTTLDNSGYRDLTLLSKYSGQLEKDSRFKVSAEIFKREDTAPMNPTSNPPLDILELGGSNTIKRNTFNLIYTNTPKNNPYLNLNSNIYTTMQSLEKVRESDKQYELRRIISSGASISNRFIFKKFSFDSGVEVRQDELEGKRDGNNLASYPSGKSYENNFFTQFNFSVGEHLTFLPGIRFQSYSLQSNDRSHKKKKVQVLSKKLKIITKVNDEVSFKTTYSEGFNAPKVQDIFVDGLHHQGDGFFIADNYFIPNYELNHETSRMFELGFKYQKDLFSSEDLLTITLDQYWNNASHYIYYEKTDRAIIDNEVGTTQFINIPNVSLRGREFGLDYLYDRFEGGVIYSQVRGVNKEKSLYLSEMPADQYIFKLKLNFFEYGLDLGYLGINTLKQDRINSHTIERTDETPGYFIHNIFCTKKFMSGPLNGFLFGVRFDNLTNRRYRKHASHINEVGLDIKVNISYKMKYF